METFKLSLFLNDFCFNYEKKQKQKYGEIDGLSAVERISSYWSYIYIYTNNFFKLVKYNTVYLPLFS